MAFYAYDSSHPAGDSAADDSYEALADFQFYAVKEKELLGKRGIQFQEIYALSFQIRMGNQVTIVRAKQFKYGIGYYLIAPGKSPRIEDGVMTDDGLLEVVKSYFGSRGSRR